MHRTRPIRLLAALSLALAVAVAGCGAGRTDSDQIGETVERAFTDNDPKLCGELLTETFIEAFYGTLEACERSAGQGANADSVEVLQVKVTGDRATALVKASGGSASPKPTTLRLVKDDGDWKIDSVAGTEPRQSGSG